MIPHETVNDDSVTLIAWLVANGEPVTEGQAVAVSRDQQSRDGRSLPGSRLSAGTV